MKPSPMNGSTLGFRRLGRTDAQVSGLAFGAFKLGRNEKIKYPNSYALPTELEAEEILNGILDLGINWIDTAPAYGLSEERIGKALQARRKEFFLSSKVGEEFESGESRYLFHEKDPVPLFQKSLERSLRRLRTDSVDALLFHSDGRDLEILSRPDFVEWIQETRRKGLARWIGFSGKTPEGARMALSWSDLIMVEYHLLNRDHETVIAEAAQQGVGVLVKKGLGAGHLNAFESINFLLKNPGICSIVVGSLSLKHMKENWEHCQQFQQQDPRPNPGRS